MKTPRVLVVDDEPINLTVIKAILETQGAEAVTVSSGREAVELCEADGARFDMILLDVHMPRMSGLETAAALRALEATREVPIMFVSARATKADQEAGLAAGANYYLTKPFRRKDLLEAIARFLPSLGPAA